MGKDDNRASHNQTNPYTLVFGPNEALSSPKLILTKISSNKINIGKGRDYFGSLNINPRFSSNFFYSLSNP